MRLWFTRDQEIRGLSVMQPWASLLPAIGAKTIETRSKTHPYRGLVAIHSSKNFPKVYRSLCWSNPFREALVDVGLESNDEQLPLGMILAVARLDLIVASEDILAGWQRLAGHTTVAAESAREQAFGDFGPTRYGWFLKDVVRLKTPVPATGALGLWTFDKQPEALADVRRQLREAA